MILLNSTFLKIIVKCLFHFEQNKPPESGSDFQGVSIANY